MLKCSSAETPTIGWKAVFGRAGVLLKLDLPPEADEVVESPEVPVLVVPLHPLGAVVNGHTLREGDGLAEINEVDTAHVCAVVDKEKGTADHLQSMTCGHTLNFLSAYIVRTQSVLYTHCIMYVCTVNLYMMYISLKCTIQWVVLCACM